MTNESKRSSNKGFRVLAWFGMDPVPEVKGFTRSSRGARLPVCDRCGALVAFEARDRHLQWHQQMG